MHTYKTNFSFLFILMLFLANCENSDTTSSEAGAYSTANILCDLSEEMYNDDESVNAYSKYSWACNAERRILSGNGIPNHEVGTFPNPGNPNTIRAQYVNETFTIGPLLISETGVAVGGLGVQ